MIPIGSCVGSRENLNQKAVWRIQRYLHHSKAALIKGDLRCAEMNLPGMPYPSIY